MRLTLNLDLETTITNPVDPTRVRIIEVGALLWDWDTSSPAAMMQQLVWGLPDEGYAWDDDILRLTGITHDQLALQGIPLSKVFAQLEEMTGFSGMLRARPEAIIAHNGNKFDKIVLESEVQRWLSTRSKLAPTSFNELMGLPWIDSSTDINYPSHITTRKLTHLAAEHKIINPFAHRALPDTLVMSEMIAKYDLDKMLKHANSPKLRVLAQILPPWKDKAPVGHKQVDKAKKLGFRFDSDSKSWYRECAEFEVDELLKDCGFNIEVINDEE